MSLEEASEYALSKKGSIHPPHLCGGATGRRTHERAYPPGGGSGCPRRPGLHQPRDIYQALDLERTAGNHVASILKKLGLRSRAQIASWATERELLVRDPD